MQSLIELYKNWHGSAPKSIDKLSGAGSNRAYFRIIGEDDSTYIGVVGTSVEENNAFLTIANHFHNKHLNVPEVFAASQDNTRYIQQDLGSVALFDAIKRGREASGSYNKEEIELLKKTISLLPELQILGGSGMDWSVCYPQPEFDEMNVMFDLNYFKYSFLKATGIDFNEVRLEYDFRKLATDLVSCSGNAETFMYRDFQARNVMLTSDNEPYFIDFQGGRKGPLYYDVASFLWQASAHYSDELRQMLIDVYYKKLQEVVAVNSWCEVTIPEKEDFHKTLSLFVLFRTLQVLGAYGFRGYFERKPHFINSIPAAIENLRHLSAKDYPYLEHVITQLTSLPQFSL